MDQHGGMEDVVARKLNNRTLPPLPFLLKAKAHADTRDGIGWILSPAALRRDHSP